jgi:hypothetical protein
MERKDRREIDLQKGLSYMRGSSHVQFLEGLWGGPWPKRCPEIASHRPTAQQRSSLH